MIKMNEQKHKDLGLCKMSASSNLNIITTVLKARFKIISRYKGALLFEFFIPIVFAAMPIMLGTAIAGGSANAAVNFQNNTAYAGNPGTMDYKLYMLIGANTFMTVSLMLWLVGYWIRREQETGTLEPLYLSPAKKIYVVSGVTLYALIRASITFFVSFFLGSLIFGVNPFQGNILLALLFLFIGLIPLWGISFLFGALILKIKEANSLIQMMQWIVAFFMGVYFPVTMFPPFLRYIAMAFPPTWMNNGVRASLLNLSYFFGTWYADLAMICVFGAVVPLLGYYVFMKTGQRMKRNEGVGQF